MCEIAFRLSYEQSSQNDDAPYDAKEILVSNNLHIVAIVHNALCIKQN